VPDFTKWPSFPFEGDLRVKELDDPVAVEPPRKGEGAAECIACNAPDEAYIWVSERWRVRTMDRPTGLPMVLILESRSHLDLGDLPNLLAAELGVMTVRLERAIRSLDNVARVHVNRWGDGSAHLHMWFLARPYGRLQLRGTFLSLWDDILPPISESTWRENLALVAAWLAEFGGRPLAEPPRIQWQAPSNLVQQAEAESRAPVEAPDDGVSVALAEAPPEEDAPGDGDDQGDDAELHTDEQPDDEWQDGERQDGDALRDGDAQGDAGDDDAESDRPGGPAAPARSTAGNGLRAEGDDNNGTNVATATDR
jgi:diadenosine tetraphosphate (Ap4A) HIT family hydrolase